MPKNTVKQPPAETEPSTSDHAAPSRVLYIGHLPHGFYELQLKGFFSQFGTVSRLRVSRNKKTGKAKHYAFLEFQSPEVHEDLFKGANRKFKQIPWQQIELERHNKERTAEQQAERLARAVSRDKKRKQQIEAAGIEYSYDTLDVKVAKKRKAKTMTK